MPLLDVCVFLSPFVYVAENYFHCNLHLMASNDSPTMTVGSILQNSRNIFRPSIFRSIEKMRQQRLL